MRYLIPLFAVVLIGCGATSHPAALRADDGTVYKLIDTDIDLGDSDTSPSVTLNFKNNVTGAKVNEKADASGLNDDRDDVKTLLHKLDWLNVGECYTNPLSSQDHKQVPCG